MTQRVLEIFVKVCEKMSMTQAAQELYISQSAVSHAIRVAEETCGVRLFLRKNGQLQLTPYGVRMLSYSQHILDHMDNIRHEVQSAALESSTIRIGCTSDVMEYLMFDLLEEYRALDNSHHVFLSSHLADQMDSFLLRHELDLAIIEDAPETPGLELITLFRDSMLYACRRDSRQLELPPEDGTIPVLPREAVDGVPIYLHHRFSHLAQPPENQYPLAGLSLIPAGSFNNSATLEKAIRKDLGIGLISSMALPFNPDFRAFNIAGMQYSRFIHLVRDTSPFPPPAVMDFVDFIYSYIRRHIPEQDRYI